MEELIKLFLVLLLIPVFAMIFAFPLMWVWDWIVPDLFGLRTITYWEEFGLFCLGRLILK